MTTTIQQHYTAVLAVLNAALPATAKAYKMGDPAIATDGLKTYTEVIISRRFGGIARMDSTLDSYLHRITSRYVADRENNADVQRTKTHTALEYAVLSIGGESTTPIQFEAEEAVAPDDGWFSGATDWTYAL